MRVARNKTVVIEADTTEDIERIAEEIGKAKTGLETARPSKKNPAIMIFGMDSKMDESTIVKEIWQQNLLRKGVTQEEAEKNINAKFSTRNGREETCNWVLETSPRIRRILEETDRVYMKWTSHRYKDYVIVMRCFKCLEYGHTSTHCTAKENACGHCAQTGHVYKECPNKKEEPTCVLCKRRGHQNQNHTTRDSQCHEFQRALYIGKLRTDNG